jgi:hypothetical protein
MFVYMCRAYISSKHLDYMRVYIYIQKNATWYQTKKSQNSPQLRTHIHMQTRINTKTTPGEAAKRQAPVPGNKDTNVGLRPRLRAEDTGPRTLGITKTRRKLGGLYS